MICPDCNYENNTEDALFCGLCGKAFRKEKVKEKTDIKTNKEEIETTPREFTKLDKKADIQTS
ncbi:hypothetical protein HY792_02870 [Candidatus Desantisbacteria bacterium]|nr:hypothetical protein [Candidatus Desantisbacteria bacterium]